MANPPQPDGSWLGRRSHALAEVAQFIGWCLRRMVSPRRVPVTLALIVAAAASPWMVLRFGALGWIWTAATGLALLLYGALLLISFLKIRLAARETEVVGRVSALAADHGLREVRLKDSLSGQIGDLERRLTSLIDNRVEDLRVQSAGQIQGIQALSADRLDVLRTSLESRIDAVAQGGAGVEAAVHAMETTLDSLAATVGRTTESLGALDSNIKSDVSAIQASLTARDGDLERFTAELHAVVESRILQAQARQDEARAALELAMAARLDAALQHPQALLDTLEARLASERGVIQNAFIGLRSDIEQLFEQRGQKSEEAFAYLRALLDRRVQAGATAVRGEVDALKAEIGARLASIESAGPAQPPAEFIEEIAALQGRVAEIGDLRQRVAEALMSHETTLRAVSEKQEASVSLTEQLRAEVNDLSQSAGSEVQSLRLSISEALQREAGERTAAIHAVAVATAERQAALEATIQSAAPALDARISELKSLMEARMGPEFEARLEAWRARLDNEIGAALQQGRSEDALATQEREARLRSELQTLHDALLRQREDSQNLQEAVSRSMEAVRSDLATKLDSDASEEIARAAQDAVASLREETAARFTDQDHASQRDVSRLSEALESVRGASALDAEAIEARVGSRIAEGVLARIEALKSETDAAQAIILERASSAAEAKAAESVAHALARTVSREDLAAVVSATEELRSRTASRDDVEEVRKLVQEASRKAGEQGGRADAAKSEDIARIEKGMKEVEARAASSAHAMRRLSDANAAIARPFDRLLANDKIQRIEQHWLKAFGINMTRTALAYMAHKICLLEDRGMGRIAAPIETIVMRQLALRSLPNRGRLEVMEIGTLFGLGAAVLYNFRGARAAGMNLTLVDPLEGYYEAGGADPVTGVEVSEAVLRKNLADLDVPDSDYRLIKALSADPQAIRPASDRLYDLILVDGDHSTAGVAADFENYGPLVKPGGLMIFDDYGSEHWPGIQPYVDETVRTDPNWIWIGADYRTAVVAKKADGATAKVTPRTAAKAAGARSASTKR